MYMWTKIYIFEYIFIFIFTHKYTYMYTYMDLLIEGTAADRFDAVIFAYQDKVHLLQMFRRFRNRTYYNPRALLVSARTVQFYLGIIIYTICINLPIHKYILICTYASIYILYVLLYTNVYLCTCIFMYLYICIYTYICIYGHTH
jgi:hypothetical protein